MGALKICESPWLHPRLLCPKFLMGFCSDRYYECAYKVHSFTRSWDNRGYLKIFGSPWICPCSLSQKFLMQFVWMDPVNVQVKYAVCTFTRSWDNKGYLKTLVNPQIRPWSLFSKIFNGLLFGWTLWMHGPNLMTVALPVPGIIAIDFLGGVANPLSWGRGGHKGSGMVPFERALVSSYRPSIVTFPLPLHVSDILSLLCSSTPLFPTPRLVSLKFPHGPLGEGGWPLGCEEWRCWANCSCS